MPVKDRLEGVDHELRRKVEKILAARMHPARE